MAKGWLYPWAIGSIALGGASLLVPLYVVELGGDAFALGLLAAVAAFVGVPGAIVFGRWADTSGKRRPYVLFALALITLTLTTIPMIEELWIVILANGLIWFAFAAAMPVLTLLSVADAPAYAWSERIARLNKYQGIGWAIGLLLGSVWTALVGPSLGPRDAIGTFFFVMAGLSAIALVVGLKWFPADDPKAGPVSSIRLRAAIRRSDRFNIRAVTFPLTVTRFDLRTFDPNRLVDRFTPALALYFLALVLVFTGFAAFFAPLPAYLAEVGFSSDEIFALYLVSSLASAVCFGLAGRLAGIRDIAMVQAGGLLIRGLAFPVVGLAGVLLTADAIGLMLFASIFGIIGITWAVITVTAGTIVTVLTPISIRGEALGMYAALTALAGGIGALLGGWLGAIDYLIGFTFAGGLILVGAVVVFSLRGPRMRPTPDSERPE